MSEQPEMRLVPVEPTDAMFAAFRDADYNSAEGFRQAWAAALSAALQPEPVGDLREKVAKEVRQAFGDFNDCPAASRGIADYTAERILALSDTAGVGLAALKSK